MRSVYGSVHALRSSFLLFFFYASGNKVRTTEYNGGESLVGRRWGRGGMLCVLGGEEEEQV